MLSHGYVGEAVRPFLGLGYGSREQDADRLGSLSGASEFPENALERVRNF